MKDKVKRFLSEKKELLLFVGILAVVFTSVMIIASVAFNDDDSDPIVDINNGTTGPNLVVEPTQIEPEKILFGLPVTDDATMIRCYYSPDKSEDTLQTAVIMNNNIAYESTGVTYVNGDDSQINVYAVYDGKVTGISVSDAFGTILEITHDENIVTYYSSLASCNVKVDDVVKKGDLLGSGGMNVFDKEASNHVTFEVKVNGTYVDPELIYDKTIEEVSSMFTEK